MTSWPLTLVGARYIVSLETLPATVSMAFVARFLSGTIISEFVPIVVRPKVPEVGGDVGVGTGVGVGVGGTQPGIALQISSLPPVIKSPCRLGS